MKNKTFHSSRTLLRILERILRLLLCLLKILQILRRFLKG